MEAGFARKIGGELLGGGKHLHFIDLQMDLLKTSVRLSNVGLVNLGLLSARTQPILIYIVLIFPAVRNLNGHDAGNGRYGRGDIKD